MIRDPDNVIVYAHIYSYKGMSLGAIHYYCEFRCGGETTKATAPLSVEHATCLNKENRRRGYKTEFYRPGKDHDGFLEYDDAVGATLTYKSKFPQARCLLLGTHSAVMAFPVLALDGPESVRKKLNSIAEQAKGLPWKKADPMVEEWEKTLAVTLQLDWVPWI